VLVTSNINDVRTFLKLNYIRNGRICHTVYSERVVLQGSSSEVFVGRPGDKMTMGQPVSTKVLHSMVETSRISYDSVVHTQLASSFLTILLSYISIKQSKQCSNFYTVVCDTADLLPSIIKCTSNLLYR